MAAWAQWLEIKLTDDEKTRNKKKKLQKSWKSKLRFQRLDLETKQRQQSWLDFKKGKGAKKKVRRAVHLQLCEGQVGQQRQQSQLECEVPAQYLCDLLGDNFVFYVMQTSCWAVALHSGCLTGWSATLPGHDP